jgi:hypothetical protein
MQLVQYKQNKRYVHGVADSVSELVEFYYKWQKQHGSMVIEDTTDNYKILVTLG